MMPPHLRGVLRELEDALRVRFGARLREVRLFGSYARGEADEDSDIDVLVLVDGLGAMESAAVSDITSRIALRSGKPLAPLPMASEGLAQMRAAGGRLAAELDRDGERA
jgi:predicted nucleotidyltransferase